MVEFASGDSSLEEMRSKTRKQWESGLLTLQQNFSVSHGCNLVRWGWREEVQADEDRGGRDGYGR